jgi:site-specific recombinase XerD
MGKNMPLVSKLLGHSQLSLTQDIYTHVTLAVQMIWLASLKDITMIETSFENGVTNF